MSASLGQSYTATAPLFASRLSRLYGQLRVTSSPDNPKSIVVYASDDIEVVIWESDFFADDRCFSTIVTLDRDTLDKGFIEVEQRAAVEGRAVWRVFQARQCHRPL